MSRRASLRGTKELEEAKAKLEKLKTIVANDMQIRPKRGQIQLRIENAKEQFDQAGFRIYSDPIELLGFKWKLCATVHAEKQWIGLYLYLYTPENYTGPICVEIDASFRILNQFRSKDVQKNFTNKFCDANANNRGYAMFAEIKMLLNPTNGFISPDGCITVDVEFTAQSSTMEHVLSQF